MSAQVSPLRQERNVYRWLLLIRRCEQAGASVVWDEPLEGLRRAYVDDPFGNRIELMEPLENAPKGTEP